MSGPTTQETRRSARVTTTLLVGIEGVDDAPVLRRGDISATGVYFETNKPVGSTGTVQLLSIASADGAREVRLMAHVVRALTLEELGGARTYGVAFEFMPESEAATKALEAFVDSVLLGVDGARHTGAESLRAGALFKQLSVRTMTLEASWNVAIGERIRLELNARGLERRVRLEGSAVRVTPRRARRGASTSPGSSRASASRPSARSSRWSGSRGSSPSSTATSAPPST